MSCLWPPGRPNSKRERCSDCCANASVCTDVTPLKRAVAIDVVCAPARACTRAALLSMRPRPCKLCAQWWYNGALSSGVSHSQYTKLLASHLRPGFSAHLNRLAVATRKARRPENARAHLRKVPRSHALACAPPVLPEPRFFACVPAEGDHALRQHEAAATREGDAPNDMRRVMRFFQNLFCAERVEGAIM